MCIYMRAAQLRTCMQSHKYTHMHARTHTYTHRHTVKLNKEAIRRSWLRWPSSLSKQNKISACKYLKVTISKPKNNQSQTAK